MSMESDTRDRVIKLEAEVQHLKEDIAEIKIKTAAMYDILNQAKGMKLAGFLLVGGFGFLISWVPTLYNFIVSKGA